MNKKYDEHDVYKDLFASIASTYTEAEKVNAEIKVSVYWVDKETIKYLCEKYKGDLWKNSDFTSAIIPFWFWEVLFFDKIV